MPKYDYTNATIDKGDVVIIEKVGDKYSSINKGDIIAFKYSNFIIVHRVINIIRDRGEYFFYTKGDNKKDNNNFVIKEDMIEGIIKLKIPFIGFPTLWLNEL